MFTIAAIGFQCDIMQSLLPGMLRRSIPAIETLRMLVEATFERATASEALLRPGYMSWK